MTIDLPWQLFDSTPQSAPAPEHRAETHWIEDARFGRYSLDPAEGAYLEERRTEFGGHRALTSLHIGSYSLAPAELAQCLQALLARLDDFDEHARAALDRALSEMSPRVTGYLDFHLQEVPEVLEWLSNCTGHGELLGRASLLQQLGLRGVCFGDLEQSGHITGPMIVTLDYTVGDSHSSRLTDEILCVRLDENGRVLHIAHES